jgi:hypothetical protein
MKPTNKDLNNLLDEVTAGIRNENLDPAEVKQSADRVWANLSNQCASEPVDITQADHIRNCADFQSLIPAYLQDGLSDGRKLLFEDHTRECIPCRKALKQARSAGKSPADNVQAGVSRTGNTRLVVLKWAVAATLIVGLSFIIVPVITRITNSGGTVQAVVFSASGPVYRVTDTESLPISSGEKIQKGEKIRTSRDAGAEVRLADGSMIEMRERSEFSLTENQEGTTIHLERGNIIVQAAKQRSKHLYVATPECLVSVTGTIFSVNSGTKGSRVSVIEGEVQVDQNGESKVLHPGKQYSTNPNLGVVPVKEEISWSKNSERYLALIAELSSLRNEINHVQEPGVRYSTRLLDSVPEGTVFYAAIPNLSATLAESQRILQERIQQNAVLKEWWENERASSRRDVQLDQIIDKIREFGEYLGAEIVVSARMDDQGHPEGPLVVAELSNPAGIQSFLEKQIESLGAKGKDKPVIRFISDPLAAQPENGNETGESRNRPEILVWIHGDLLAAAHKLEHLQRLAATLNSPGTNSFVGSPLHSRIADIYRDGAGLIVAADLEKVIAGALKEEVNTAKGSRQADTFKKLGLLNLKYFILEHKQNQGRTHNRAVLTFNEPRQGITSWLAAPGPMGALEFISPDANVVAAFVVKEPATLVDDLLNMVPEMKKHFDELEAKHGLNIRNDFAAPLGGEFAFAIDGPVLPTPSWKMVFEVYDPAKLQQSFERVVDEINLQAARGGDPGLQWEKADIGGRTFYTLKSISTKMELSYTFANGYLVAGPNRALIERSLRYRESGYTLLRSPKFMATLPEDGNTNFSALFYHDLSALLKPLTEQRQDLKPLAALATPSLAYAYAQGDRIIFATNSEGDPFGLGPASLLGVPGSFGIQQIIGQSLKGQSPKR